MAQISVLAHASHVTPEQAKQLAMRFFGQTRAASPTGAADIQLAYTASTSMRTQQAAYYVFNVANNGGFIIIAADDRVQPILGYADSGAFDYQSLPDAMRWIMTGYQRQIEAVERIQLPVSKSIATSWEQIRSNRFPANAEKRMKLETALWRQEAPFNRYIPNKKLVGCVGVAMSIIMKYHNHPQQGYGNLNGVDFNVRYDWNSMRMDNYLLTTSTEAEENAVAQIMYHAAHSVLTDFGQSGSSASEVRVPTALSTYFGYDAGVSYKKKTEMSSAAWEALIKNELDANRPVLYSGQDAVMGHAFVCDGYETRAGQTLFHINWGWGGMANGYFALTALTPQGQSGNIHNYTEQATVIYNIKPSTVASSTAHSPVRITSDEKQIGMSTDRASIATGDAFSIRVGSLKNTSYTDFNGQIAIALFTADGRFKTLLSKAQAYSLPSFVVDNRIFLDFQCRVPDHTSVDAEDRIKLATQAAGTSTWLPASGDLITVNEIHARNHPIGYFNIDMPQSVPGATIQAESNRVIQGRAYTFRVIPDNADDVVLVKANGYIITAAKDHQYQLPNVIEPTAITVTVLNANNIRTNKTLWTESGRLESLISETDRGTIKNLALYGTMDARDFSFIRDKMRIDTLNLAGITITAQGGNPANAIPERAFYRYASLQHITLPDNLTRLCNRAFEATGLREITLPASIATYEYNIFLNCNRLVQVTARRSKPEFINWCVFAGTPKKNLTVPVGALQAYSAKDNWKDFNNKTEEYFAESTTCQVIIQDEEGIRITPLNASGNPVVPGSRYRFTVETGKQYADYRMRVFANTSQLTPVNGVYETTITRNTLIHVDLTEPAPATTPSPWKMTGIGMVTDLINAIPGRPFQITVNAMDIPTDYFESGLFTAAVLTDRENRIKEVISPIQQNAWNNTGKQRFTYPCNVTHAQIAAGNLIRIATSTDGKEWNLVYAGTSGTTKDALKATGNEVIYHTITMPESIEKASISNYTDKVIHGMDYAFSVRPYLSSDVVDVTVNGKPMASKQPVADVRIDAVTEDLNITIAVYDQHAATPYTTVNIGPGELAEALSHIPNQPWKLRITGEMNAADFATIAANSSLLTEVDLSDVRILAQGNNQADALPVNAFAGVTGMPMNLQIVRLPKSLKRIENAAFYRCMKLQEITLPANLTYIGVQAFFYATNLKKVVVQATTPINLSNGNPFSPAAQSKATLSVPAGSVEAYRQATYWKQFGNIETYTATYSVSYPETVIPQGGHTGDNITGGQDFQFKVTTENCLVTANGTPLTADANGIYTLTDIRSNYAIEVTPLYQVTFQLIEGVTVRPLNSGNSTTVKSGDNFSFTLESSLSAGNTLMVKANQAEIIAENGVYTLERIRQNQLIQTFLIPAEGTSLPGHLVTAVDSATASTLQGISLAGALSPEVFEVLKKNFSSLTTIDLQEVQNQQLPDQAFKNMHTLQSIELPAGLTHIGNEAFAGCSNLENLTLTQVTHIGEKAFDGCNRLTSITLFTTPQQTEYRTGKLLLDHVFEGLNPNCLIFVMEGVAEGKNIVANTGNGYRAQGHLTLDPSYPFSNPNDFSMGSYTVSYTHNFDKPVADDRSTGWEVLTLPFAPTQVTDGDKVSLKPVGAVVNEGEKTFLLRSLEASSGQQHNDFFSHTAMLANKPYIVLMPEGLNKTGITFSGGGDTCYVTATPDSASLTVTGANYALTGTYAPVAHTATRYALNAEGSAFCRPAENTARNIISAFSAYGTGKEPATEKGYEIGADDLTVGMEHPVTGTQQLQVYVAGKQLVIETQRSCVVRIYTAAGHTVGSYQLKVGKNRIGQLPQGIYLIGNRKIRL